jgi:predicted HNH restriction endonuclease
MTTKPRRHIMVPMICEYCKTEFMSPKSRVKEGRGKFCSRECSRAYVREHPVSSSLLGKEKAKATFDKKRKAYYAYWIDPETGKQKSTTYARWYWETHKGAIPDGYRVSYKDNNYLNIDPDNFVLISPDEFGRSISERLMGHGFSDETLKKMSEAKKDKPLSEEHKANIGKATKEMWDRGVFDDPRIRKIYSDRAKLNRGMKLSDSTRRRMSESHIQYFQDPKNYEKMLSRMLHGDAHPNWRGGASKEKYPPEFSKRLREQVRKRDGYRCRICHAGAKGVAGRVHHIDADKKNNKLSNLILLCKTCHGEIHGQYPTSDPLVSAFRSMLYRGDDFADMI